MAIAADFAAGTNFTALAIYRIKEKAMANIDVQKKKSNNLPLLLLLGLLALAIIGYLVWRNNNGVAGDDINTPVVTDSTNNIGGGTTTDTLRR